MAIIGKIREKSWLILIVIGGALVTFIFTSQGPGGGGQVEEKYGIGTIYGEKVDLDGFDSMVNEEQEGAQRQKDQQLAQQGKQPGSEKAEPVDRARVWQRYTEELILEKEYEALGIEVSEAEFDAYLFGEEGFTVLPDLAQAFSDSVTKLFNPKLLQAKIDEMETSEDPEVQEQWELSKEYYTDLRRKQKYLDILGQGVYVTNLEAKDEYFAKEEKKSVSFVLKRYSSINNDDIKVTDKKLKAYFSKHKSEKIYENKIAARQIRFADLLVQPSEKDIKTFNKMVSDLKKGFLATGNDSNYVIDKSDFKFYRSDAYSTILPMNHGSAQQHLTYPASHATEFETAELGDVIGPYDHQGTTNVAKIIGFTKDTINARHILLPVTAGDEATTQKLADSIMEVINSDNFVEFVKKYSTDTGSKEKDGELGDFFFSKMVQPFAMYCAEKPIGEIGQVRSQFGIHIIEVLDRKGPNRPRVAILQKTLVPSQETIEKIESNAYGLLEKLYNKVEGASSDAKKIAAFDTLVKKAGTMARPVDIFDNSPQLNGFSSQFAEAEIFKLAYKEEAKIGDLISSPIKDGERWVVAIVSAIKVKGETKFEDVKAIVEREYIQHVKYKRLSKGMKGKTLETLVDNKKVFMQTEEVIFGSTQLGQNIRDEPEVIGTLFGALKDGEMTQPIKGKEGVFVVRIERTIPAQVAKDYVTEKDQMTGTIRGGLKAAATSALIDQADVIDNRRFREIGVRR